MTATLSLKTYTLTTAKSGSGDVSSFECKTTGAFGACNPTYNDGETITIKANPDSPQTHNVPFTLPGDAGYSPLWLVSVYDNADFPEVHDQATALKAKILGPGVATVNCPIVSIEP